jgi:dihydropteroate synthase
MGIVNITPDSFSDGGSFLDPAAAFEKACRLVEEGADLLDLGAESTRPGGGVYGEGSQAVAAEVELARLLPVLEMVRRALPETVISVDTRKTAVARAALAAGADWINDIGGLRDPELLELMAAADCPVVAMHSRGELATMQRQIDFQDVVSEVRAELGEMLEHAVASGIDRANIVLDPGIGFGKTAAGNIALLRELECLNQLGQPLLVGASRKSFISAVGGPAAPHERLGGSLAAVAACYRKHVAIVRVHDVRATVQFLEISRALDEGQ